MGLASGKLNNNVSKSVRKDAAFLAKQLEKQVNEKKLSESREKSNEKFKNKKIEVSKNETLKRSNDKIESTENIEELSLQDQLAKLAQSLIANNKDSSALDFSSILGDCKKRKID